MEIKMFTFNPVSENTYIVSDETKKCVIIDAGAFYPQECDLLWSYIEENKLQITHLLNTHLHFDHIFGNAFVSEKTKKLPEANVEDEFLLPLMLEQVRAFNLPDVGLISPPSIGTYLKEGDTISFGNQEFQIFEVPGHSPGSIAFYSKEGHCVFVGDALFYGSIGRTDLPKGNHQQLLNSIQNKLFTLPADTVVYPGHGPATTIGTEIASNPFFR